MDTPLCARRISTLNKRVAELRCCHDLMIGLCTGAFKT